MIARQNWIPLNKILARSIGLYEALILAELANEYEFHLSNGKLLESGWFYCTVVKLENETTLSKKQQTKPLNRLQEMGLLEIRRMGIPAKRHFKINEAKVEEVLLDQKGPTGQSETLFPDDTIRSNKKDGNGPPNNKNKDNNLYQEMMSLYSDWYKGKMGIPPKIDGKDGNALKSLIKYFSTVKTGNHTELDVFKFIFDNWDRVETFYAQKTRLLEINSNIQAIMVQIKEGGSKKSRAKVGDKLQEYLDK